MNISCTEQWVVLIFSQGYEASCRGVNSFPIIFRLATKTSLNSVWPGTKDNQQPTPSFYSVSRGALSGPRLSFHVPLTYLLKFAIN